jgi:hypothetical protein
VRAGDGGNDMSLEVNIQRARIYVSFAGEDRARAMELVRWLNDSGWHVVADERHAFAAGDKWSPSSRLDSRDVILCVITPGWLVSRFCHHEFSYCAKRGKFILPVICELSDVGLLPPAVRALPRIDLTHNRLVDYLALKEVLSQAHLKTGDGGTVETEGKPNRMLVWMRRDLRVIGLLLTSVMLAAVVTLWLWARN